MAKTVNKKGIQKQVEEKLAESFPEIKGSIGEKKFAKKVKKASKILASGVTRSKARTSAKKKAATGENKSKAS